MHIFDILFHCTKTKAVYVYFAISFFIIPYLLCPAGGVSPEILLFVQYGHTPANMCRVFFSIYFDIRARGMVFVRKSLYERHFTVCIKL